MLKPEFALENKKPEILWDFEIKKRIPYLGFSRSSRPQRQN